VMALQRYGLTPDRGPIVVTGANGGVGTVAVSLLSGLGYEVIERDVWPGFDESRLNQNCDIVVGSIGWLVESLASQ